MSYTTSSITQLNGVDAVRKNPGLFVGNTATPIKLVEELLDNALDEAQAGFCNHIILEINTKDNEIIIVDNGRGFPFDQTLPIEEDRPVFACLNLHTSGKFNKGDTDSPYKIASGLHGVGLTAVYALSKFVEFDIYGPKEYGHYVLRDDMHITRDNRKLTKKDPRPYSTKIKCVPSENFFESMDLDLDIIEERLKIASVNLKHVKLEFIVDGKTQIIKVQEDDIIKEYLTNTKKLKWFEFNVAKNDEYATVKLAWDDEPPITTKVFTSVNLSRVHTGVHVRAITNAIRDILVSYKRRTKFEFNDEDCFNWLRLYMNMGIVNTSFEAQVKVKLERNSDISILDSFSAKIKAQMLKDKDFLDSLLERFHVYRQNVSSKKIMRGVSTKTRSSSLITSLKDCSGDNGELIIGEGESAITGLKKVRDAKKHALLPLRGVIINSVKKKDFMNSNKVKEIIHALGCSVNDFKLEDLRYDKIIIAADADPAGHFITTLTIILFANVFPEIIKHGKLFVCETPLYGTGENETFKPIWSDKELEKVRQKNPSKIRRLKGLGEFNPDELKILVLDDSTRRLIKVNWDQKHIDKLFQLVTSAEEKRKLALGKWRL